MLGFGTENLMRSTLHVRKRNRLINVRDEVWRRLRTTGQLPANKIKKAARLRRIGIVETLSVKVPWEFSIGHTLPGCLRKVYIQ